MSLPTVLAIAGSDPSGGAGLEADQKTIAAHKCYALTATTALTAQNTQGVRDTHNIPASFVRQQIDACLDDIKVDVIKTGMLAAAETIEVVAKTLRTHESTLSVVDPVMASTSGHLLLPHRAVKTLREQLIPQATVLTPNIHEAKIILEDAGEAFDDPRSQDDLLSMAIALQELGSKHVLLKGGHLPMPGQVSGSGETAPKEVVVDVLYGGGEVIILKSDYVSSARNTHGTGCSLASAIASNLATGSAMAEAVKLATEYVHAGIETGFRMGQGNGPINHFHSLYRLPFAPGRFVEYLLRRSDVQAVWRRYVNHEFANRLATNTLPFEAFKRYMVQDYLYLIQFARAHSLAAYKANNMDDIVRENQIVLHINYEMKLHREYCRDFGIDEQELGRSRENLVCTAYTRYFLDIGSSQDYFALQVALAPCLLGYGEVGERLYNDPETVRANNPYLKWIENYVANDYRIALKAGEELLERYATQQSVSRIEDLAQIFVRATEMEIAFWDMSLGRSSTPGV